MTLAETPNHALTSAVIELEAHVNADGWDQPIRFFALARRSDLVQREPALAASLGLDPISETDDLIPIEQEWGDPNAELDEALAGIAWPDQVVGAALAIERLLLPPSAEAELDAVDPQESARIAAEHPERKEVRLAAAVLRDGRKMCAIRLREDDSDDAVLSGSDLLPGLTDALAATFAPES